MFVVAISSRFNRNLLRNIISERYLSFSTQKEQKENTNKVNILSPINDARNGLMQTSFQQFRLYAVKSDDAHKENWYSDEELHEVRKKRDAQWKRLKVTLIVICTIFGISTIYLVYALGSPKLDEAGNVVEDEFTQMPLPTQFLKRMSKEIESYHRIIRQPVCKKLLPDPPVYPYFQPAYTLILEMSDLLIHADWTYKTGWRFKKRPGVDKFLEMVTIPMFELVVFTAEQGASTIPLIEALDPNGYIIHKLTRDSTEFVEGDYVKNLEYLNRDLSKVIVVDWNKSSVKYHNDNTIIVPRWNGQDDDKALVDLAVFLRAIGSSGVEDVREVLAYYNQFENPVEAYRDKQRMMLEQMEETEEQKRKQGTNFASREEESDCFPEP